MAQSTVRREEPQEPDVGLRFRVVESREPRTSMVYLTSPNGSLISDQLMVVGQNLLESRPDVFFGIHDDPPIRRPADQLISISKSNFYCYDLIILVKI